MNETDSSCGFSLECPFCFTSIEKEVLFVDSLRSPDGTRFIQDGRSICTNKHGNLVDHYIGHYLDSNGKKLISTFMLMDIVLKIM